MATINPTRRHLLILTAICAVAYFLGLTNHGITAWHEGQRVLVARQMLDQNQWLIPTMNGRPYLAKPPLFYWVQMGIASIRGSSVTLLDTRLAVAIFGWLAVVITYFAARDMLEPPGELDEDRGRQWTLRASFWAAAMLATGIDYVRSARIGELDMLLPAFTTACVWMVYRAWRSHLNHQRTDWLACLIAALAAALAGLAKGPPALVTLALGAYGGILLHAARSNAPLRVHPEIPVLSKGQGEPALPAPPSARLTWIGAILGLAIALAFSIPQVEDLRDAIGCVVGAAMFALVLGSLAPLVSVTRARAAFAAMSRTHPILVLGLPLLVLYAWIGAVNARIDPGLLDAWAGEEVGDNLRPFRPASPLSILEASSFGVGLGSLAFFATIIWFTRGTPRLRPGAYMLLAWSLGGLIAFSLFGKGLARYVLPVWPAMAMIGGLGVAEAFRLGSLGTRRRLGFALTVATIAMTVFYGAWYGSARDRFYATRSPRDFVAELLARGVDPRRLGTFEIYDPSLAYYVEAMTDGLALPPGITTPIGDVRTRVGLTGIEPWTLEQLEAEVRRAGPYTVILRETQTGSRSSWAPAIERLAAGGLIVSQLPIEAEYRLAGGRTRLLAVRVEAR